jgi:hypothetical protein
MKSVKSILLIATLICSLLVANSVVAVTEPDDPEDVTKIVTEMVDSGSEETETTKSVTSELPSADIIEVTYDREAGGTKVDISFEVNQEGQIETLNTTDESSLEELLNSSTPLPLGYIIIVNTGNSSYTMMYEAGVCRLDNGTELDYTVEDNVFDTSFNLRSTSEEISQVGVISLFLKMESFTSIISYSDAAPDSFKLLAEITAPSEATVDNEVNLVGVAFNPADILGFSMLDTDYTYKWDLDDDGVTDETGESITHTFQYTGTYPVSLTVVDSENNEATASTTITVTEGSSDDNGNTDTPDDNNGGDTEGGSGDTEDNPILIFIAIIGIIVVIGIAALVVVIRR